MARFTGGTGLLGPTGSTPMLHYLGRTPDASWFALRTFTGREMPPTFPRPVTYDDPRTMSAVWEPRFQAAQLAYHRPIYLGEYSGSIRDELTRRSLANVSPLPEGLEALEPRPQSYVARLTAVAEASRQKYVEQAWAQLRAGDLIKAKACFESAAVIDHQSPAPLIGKLLCAAAGREYATVAVYIARLAEDPEGLFATFRRLSDTYRDRRVIDNILADVTTLATENPDTPDFAAVRVYLLWLDGQQSAAQGAADALAERFDDTPYAKFAAAIRKQAASASGS